MKIFITILIYVFFIFGGIILIATIRITYNKIIIDRILEDGKINYGVVVSKPESREYLIVEIKDTTIQKKMFKYENYHQVGDTIELYTHPEHLDRYVYFADNIESLAIYVGIFMSLFFFSPLVIIKIIQPWEN